MTSVWQWLFGPPRPEYVPTEQKFARAVDCSAKSSYTVFDEDVRIDIDAAAVLVLFNAERNGAGALYQVLLNERAQTTFDRRSYGGYGPLVMNALLALPRVQIPYRLNVRVRTEDGAERIERANLVVHPTRRFT